MKASNRIALIYGVSLAGAGVISYFRGRRGQDLLLDAALHGAIAGTGLNVVAWIVTENGAVPLLANPSGMGKLSDKAVALLSEIDAGSLYADMKENGVKVAPLPDNPSVITPDLD